MQLPKHDTVLVYPFRHALPESEGGRQRLAHWQQDADLAALRDPTTLAKPPVEECDAWLKLWADVQELRKNAIDP